MANNDFEAWWTSYEKEKLEFKLSKSTNADPKVEKKKFRMSDYFSLANGSDLDERRTRAYPMPEKKKWRMSDISPSAYGSDLEESFVPETQFSEVFEDSGTELVANLVGELVPKLVAELVPKLVTELVPKLVAELLPRLVAESVPYHASRAGNLNSDEIEKLSRKIGRPNDGLTERICYLKPELLKLLDEED